MRKFNVDDLVEQGLVSKKTYTEGKYKGLSIIKYKNKVFYDNLWHLDDRLLECRGIVVDEEDNIVVHPFTKVFNLGENGVDLDPNRIYTFVPKINGFLGVATWHKGEFIVSTTGSLDSDYTKLARRYLDPIKYSIDTGCSYMFEICDIEDPHIVDQVSGAYLIGIRDLCDGVMWPSDDILYEEQSLLEEYPGIIKPVSEGRKFSTFNDYKYSIKNSKTEGYMVLDFETDEVLCKIKTPHYLSKKAIMRLGKGKIDAMYKNPSEFKKHVDEEFYEIVDHIVNTVDIEIWKGYTDQQRRKFIEEYFYDN